MPRYGSRFPRAFDTWYAFDLVGEALRNARDVWIVAENYFERRSTTLLRLEGVFLPAPAFVGSVASCNSSARCELVIRVGQGEDVTVQLLDDLLSGAIASQPRARGGNCEAFSLECFALRLLTTAHVSHRGAYQHRANLTLVSELGLLLLVVGAQCLELGACCLH